MAAVRSEVLGRLVKYGGDDPSGLEANMATCMLRWTAEEMRLMSERYVNGGMIPEPDDRNQLTTLLGRLLHGYRATAVRLADG